MNSQKLIKYPCFKIQRLKSYYISSMLQFQRKVIVYWVRCEQLFQHSFSNSKQLQQKKYESLFIVEQNLTLQYFLAIHGIASTYLTVQFLNIRIFYNIKSIWNCDMILNDPNNIRATQYAKIKPRNKKRNKTTSHSHEITSDIYGRFLENICKRRLKYLKQRVNEYYGKNFPVNYKQHYHFQEEWQKRINFEEKNSEKIINQESLVGIILSFLTIIAYSLIIWSTNVDYFVKNQGKIAFYYQIYSIGMAILIFNFILKVVRENNQKEIQMKLKNMVKSEYKSIMLFFYFIIKLSGVNDLDNGAWLLYEVSMLFFLYSQASYRYHCIRITNFSLQYEYQTKVLDMIITIFIIAHIISIMLYSTVQLHPEKNWSSDLQIDRSNEFIVYIYSFYFCTTTIMTIGYGDITPKNPTEVAIVIFVQIFGVIMLAYIINQIGYCITSLRKDQQMIEKDLSILQKLKKHYNMNCSLINKVRSCILNNKPKTNQLSPEEEKGILMKLNQEIRADITKQNLVSVVKSSIFFLCRWTYHFQASISSKLIHVMFNPNDILPQPDGKQRIYIIKSGKIQIFSGRSIGKKGINNVLKTITNTIDNEISDNCYGYTSAISMRPVKLYAVSKDFTSCYYLEKQKFLQSTLERINDTEYYHELKNQIDQGSPRQSIEVPSLNSSRHHYNPSKTVVIRKYCRLSSQNQNRKYLLRHDRGTFRGAMPIFDKEIKRRIKQTFIGSVASFDTICFGQITDEIKNTKSDTNKGKQIDQLDQLALETNLKSYLDHFFQSSKDYLNYFCKSNKQEVLKRYEKNTFSSLNPSFMKKSKRLFFSQAGILQMQKIQ